MYILHLVLKTDHSLSNSLQAKALFKQQNFLARSANLLEGLYILLALISSFYLFFIFVFTMSKAISVSTGPIFTIFSPNESIFVNFLDAVQFSRFFKGRCHGNQLKLKDWRFYGPIYFVTLPFGKGLQYRNSALKN